MNLNTFSLMATASSNVRGLKASAFPETFLFRLHFFFYWSAGKYLQEQYFIAAPPQWTNMGKRRKHIQIWNGYYGSNIWYNLKICRLGYYRLL